MRFWHLTLGKLLTETQAEAVVSECSFVEDQVAQSPGVQLILRVKDSYLDGTGRRLAVITSDGSLVSVKVLRG